jgi:hypothetical protein
MAMAGVTRPKVRTVTPPDLVHSAKEGSIRIPRFQRSYRWDASDAERLFDSILRGYPIGNLLMWRKPAPAAEVAIGEQRIEAPAQASALWVVDGQQRLTTLVGALTASDETVDRRFRIFYDLRSKSFISIPHTRRRQDHWLPVWIAGDNRRLIAWQRERSWLTPEEYDQCDAVATALRTYEIPMYEIEGDDEQALREIFDRMNTFGKTLKQAEIFAALHAAPVDLQPSDLDSLRERVSNMGFGEFSTQILMQSVMAIRGGQVDRDFRKEFKNDTERHTAFEQTEKSLRIVVEFLRAESGIPHIRLLPYALFIPVLARFAALFGPPEGRSSELLRRWVWRGSAAGVAPQGNTVGLRRNASAVHGDAVASADRLLRLLPPGGELWTPDLQQSALNRAQAKINTLGLLSARPLLMAGISAEGRTELAKGARFDQLPLLSEILDRGESPLLPLLPPSKIGNDRSLTNKLLHPSGKITGNSGDGFGEALILNSKEDPEILRSHCLDTKCVKLLEEGKYGDFFNRRAGLLKKQIGDHVQRMALWGFADGTDPEAWFDDLWGDDSAA